MDRTTVLLPQAYSDVHIIGFEFDVFDLRGNKPSYTGSSIGRPVNARRRTNKNNIGNRKDAPGSSHGSVGPLPRLLQETPPLVLVHPGH